MPISKSVTPPLVAIAVLALSGPSLAATLTLDGHASAVGAEGFNQEFVSETEETLFLSDSLQQFSAGNESAGSASASSVATIDARTGEMKFALTGSRDAVVCTAVNCAATFGASSNLRIQEDITVVGTGTLSVYMQVEANWSAPRYDFTAFVSDFPNALDNADSFLNFNSAFSEESSVSTLLYSSVAIDSAGPTEMSFAWGIQGRITSNNGLERPIRNASGFMDASNTATIFYEVSDGLTVTSSTSGFLSNAAFGADTTPIAPVPLPAGLPMLFAGVVGLLAFRKNRRSAPSGSVA